MPSETKTLDEKPSSASSTAQDVMDDSSSLNSESKQDVNAGKSMADFVKENLAKQSSDEDVEGSAEGSNVEEQEETEEATTEEGGEAELDSKNESNEKEKEADVAEDGKAGEDDAKEDVDQEKKDDEAKGPVAYERFQQVNTAKNEAEQWRRENEANIKNYSAIEGFCRSKNITPEQFHKVLQVQAMINEGQYEGAIKEIRNVLGELEGVTGERLPQDIQQKVDDGKMELDDAREMARLRAQTKLGEGRVRQTEESARARHEGAMRQQLEEAAGSWEASKRASDPDYRPKKTESEPDGKWEDVRDKYLAMVNQVDAQGNPLHLVRSAAEMSTLLEKAYVAVQAKWNRLTSKRTPTPKRLPSNGSSTNKNAKRFEDAPTLGDAIRIGLKERGVTLS